MDFVYLQFHTVAELKKFRDLLPPRRVVIVVGQKILMSEFTEKEIELAVRMKGSLLTVNMNVAEPAF